MTNNDIPKHISSSPVTEDYIFTDPDNIFMDLFKNEFDRGDKFDALIKKLK